MRPYLPRLAVLAMASVLGLAGLPARSAEFGLSSDGSTIYLNGRIELQDAARFDLLAASSKARMLELDSPGGKTVAGVAIGMKARDLKLKVLVRNKATCASACGLIWVSANERYLDDKARVGFHSASESGKTVRADLANDGVAKYLLSLGLSTDFVVYALQSDPKGVSWLTHDNAAKLGVRISDPDTLYGQEMVAARAAKAGPAGPAVIRVTQFEREMPTLVEVRDGRALMNVEGLEVWVKRGSRLPGGLSVSDIGAGEVRLKWDGGERRLTASR